jgi:predicted amidohydrolase YtcJ
MKAFINGKIFTCNKNQLFAEAIVIQGNKIVFVGSNEEAKSKITKGYQIIDLNGKLMIPGFIDAHVHFINGGHYLLGIDLRNTKTISEFKNILKEYSSKNNEKWITGGYWDHEKWEEKILPSKETIDEFTQDIPVFVERTDKHLGLANSCALKLAGINKDTQVPPGGEIIKNDKTGEPTGILIDNAMNLVYSVIPKNSKKENYSATIKALDEAKKNGITTVHDISRREDLQTYIDLEKDKKLSCRIYSIQPIGILENSENVLFKINSSKIICRALKAFSDGSLGASTAWFFEPYENTNSFGLPQDIVINGKLEKLTFKADRKNLQMAVHAIGDKANAFILNLYEKIIQKNKYKNRRFRIEHAQHLRLQDIEKFVKNNIIASCQPYHLFDDGSWAEKRIGPERIKLAYPFRKFLDEGVKLCFGSDFPVVPLNALQGIYAAVTRKTSDGRNPEGWIPEQKITVEEAIKCFTINSAFAGFSENETGSIETGKFADMVVLNEDILKIPPEEIKNVEVDTTIFDGKIIYARNGSN